MPVPIRSSELPGSVWLLKILPFGKVCVDLTSDLHVLALAQSSETSPRAPSPRGIAVLRALYTPDRAGQRCGFSGASVLWAVRTGC